MSVVIHTTYNPLSKQIIYTIPANQRGAIIQRRSMIETQNNVQIFFPRSGMLPNGYQQMVVKGSRDATRRIGNIASQIVDQAIQDYKQFTERQRARTFNTHPTFYNVASEPKKSDKKTTGSRFQGLEVDAPEPKPQWPSLSKVVVPKKATSWGPHLNHTPQNTEETTISPVVITGAWGDDSDDE